MRTNDLIKRIIEKDFELKNNHSASALSCLPIIEHIYSSFDFKNDVFLLSKGHACFALYAVLEKYGFHPDWTKVHPERDVQQGITNTSGSLGHGLPLAVGIALANKIQGVRGNVHVLLGDGECQEGTTWEALLIAERFELFNLSVYVDANEYQGITELLYYESIEKLQTAFPLYPHIRVCRTSRWSGLPMMADRQAETVHEITAEELEKIRRYL